MCVLAPPSQGAEAGGTHTGSWRPGPRPGTVRRLLCLEPQCRGNSGDRAGAGTGCWGVPGCVLAGDRGALSWLSGFETSVCLPALSVLLVHPHDQSSDLAARRSVGTQTPITCAWSSVLFPMVGHCRGLGRGWRR